MLKRLLATLNRSRAEVALAYDGHRISIEKGKFTALATSEVQEILAKNAAPACEIHILANGALEFDSRVPSSTQQSIRNVVSNQ